MTMSLKTKTLTINHDTLMLKPNLMILNLLNLIYHDNSPLSSHLGQN